MSSYAVVPIPERRPRPRPGCSLSRDSSSLSQASQRANVSRGERVRVEAMACEVQQIRRSLSATQLDSDLPLAQVVRVRVL